VIPRSAALCPGWSKTLHILVLSEWWNYSSFVECFAPTGKRLVGNGTEAISLRSILGLPPFRPNRSSSAGSAL
jgi:hypothetical protein